MTRKIAVIVGVLVAWFLIADGYWKHKERVVSLCALDAQLRITNFVAQFEGERFTPLLFAYNQCRWAEGGGWDWRSLDGLAAWEIVVLLPVVHRWLVPEWRLRHE